MSKVFIVQELKRFHCPSCGGSYSDRQSDGQFKCRACHEVYQRGILKPVMDLSSVAAYGKPEVLIPISEIGIAVQPLIFELRNKLRNYGDEDYILPTGDPVAIGVCVALAADSNRGKVNILRWDRYTKQYINVKVNTKP